RLVNVDNEGNVLLRSVIKKLQQPLFGDRFVGSALAGSAYHAISENGETVFFTATPNATEAKALGLGSETDTLYARVPCVKKGPQCRYVQKVDKLGRVGGSIVGGSIHPEEGEENPFKEPTGRETVAVSARAPSPECTGLCASSVPMNATFQGASADGSKVFFTTEQQLLNSDTNAEYDLYEYDFVMKKLSLVSGGKPKTHVE